MIVFFYFFRMFRLFQIFNLLQVVISSQYQVHPGSIFEYVGETKFIHSYLDLKLDLSCSYNVFQQLVYLNSSLSSITSLLNHTLNVKQFSYNNSLDMTNTNDEIIMANLSDHQHNLILLQNKFASNIRFKLELLFNDPWIINYRSSNHKVKRGLFDIGGKLLNSLFGVATYNDLNKLNKEIELLSDNFSNNEKIFTHFRDQLHANNIALDIAFQNIKNIILTQNSIVNNIKLNELLSLQNSALFIMDSNINDINLVKQKVEFTIEAAIDHKTSSALYTFSLLNHILLDTITQLKTDSVVPITLENFHDLLHYSWTMLTVDPYTVITIFPFTNSEYYNTVHIIPFPLKINDSISEEHRVALIPPSDIYFINKQTLQYTYMSQSEYKHCLYKQKLSLCPFIFPQIPFSTPDCIVSLYTNNSLMTSSDRVKCKFSSFQSTQPFSLLINSSLLISFHESVASLLTCKRPFINEEIHTNFFFVLNPSCKLLANTFKFTNPIHLQKNRSMIPTVPFKYAESIWTKTKGLKQTNLPTYV